MGINCLLGNCRRGLCLSSSRGKGNEKIAVYEDSSSDLEVYSQISSPKSVPLLPSCKLVPLSSDRAFPYHAVGIDDQVNSVIRLLEWEDETNVAVAVILHGFGGSGKTTLADAVVTTLNFQEWNGFTFVPSMINNQDGQGDAFENKKAFIYIDNCTLRKKDLVKLVPKSCKRLRLLLTARDEMVRDVISGCGILTRVYPVRPLHSQDALELLCNKMGFSGRMQIPQHHMSQISKILKICDDVPVVLERIGAYICQRPDKGEAYMRVIEWSKSGKPFSTAEEHIIEKKGLLFDLEELPAYAKEPFLDIFSFFNGWDWDKVSCIMGEDELNILKKRALLLKKEEYQNRVMIRPIILTVGRNLTRGKRFTSVHDLTKVLEGNNLDDIRGIKGIWLQDNISEPFLMSAKVLGLMHNSLRVLALGHMTIVVDWQHCWQKFKQIIYFEAGLIPYIPFHPTTLQELRYLDWLPSNDNDLKLTKMSSKMKVLKLNGGRYACRVDIESDFIGIRILKLAEFKTLKTLLENLSSLTQLKELDLTRCRKLQHLPKDLGNLKALTRLSLHSCESLKKLPDSFGKLRSLKYLDLHSCVCLEQLPEDFGSLSCLEELDLGYVLFEELPSSFDHLSSLKVLNLMDCGVLEYLPDNIGNLSALVRIDFIGSGLLSIPPSFGQLSSFPVSVSMERCSSLRDLPEEFCSYLKSVKDLSFGHCQSLTNLPRGLVELASLTMLDLCCCTSLERLPEGFSQLKSLVVLNLMECRSLEELTADFHCLASLQSLNMQGCKKLEGKWMDTVAKIKTLVLVGIVGSVMLCKRWAIMEMEKENEGEMWPFVVRTGRKKCKNILNKVASELLTGKCLLKDSHEKPFSLSSILPNTLLLIMYEHKEDSWTGPWRLLEEIVVRHDHLLLPFQMIYVGNNHGQLSKDFADRILAYASEDSDAFLLFYSFLEANGDYPSQFLSNFVLTDVVTDEEDSKHFSRWEDITHSCVEFFLSNSSLF